MNKIGWDIKITHREKVIIKKMEENKIHKDIEEIHNNLITVTIKIHMAILITEVFTSTVQKMIRLTLFLTHFLMIIINTITINIIAKIIRKIITHSVLNQE